jgi:hypothetical protein
MDLAAEGLARTNALRLFFERISVPDGRKGLSFF